MRAGFGAICLASALALGACGSSSDSPPPSSPYYCPSVDAGATCVGDGGSYEVNIQPILAKSCLPACHDGSPDAAWPLTDPDDIIAWTSYVNHDLTTCTMPPGSSGLTISVEGRAAILNWLACSAPPP